MSQINFIFNKGLTNLFSSTSFSSTYDNSKNITDSSLNTYATTNNSTNEYIDVSLNSLVDLSNIQSIIAYNKIFNNTNPIINKLRYQTTDDVKLELNEIQLWVDNSNILGDISTNIVVSSGINSENINDKDKTTYYTSDQGIGEYIDITFDPFYYNNLQSIIMYKNTDQVGFDLSSQRLTNLILYDSSNTPIIQVDNNIQDPSFNFFKYKGPNHDSILPYKFSKVKLETISYSDFNLDELQLWVNGSNIIEGSSIIPPVYETLIATTQVTTSGNYNNSKRNWPQSYFGDTMTSNPYTFNSNTGNASVHNGTYTFTYSSGLTISASPIYMFSGGNSSIYGDGQYASFDFIGGSPYTNDDGQGYYLYTGSNYITYYDDNNNATNVYGEWVAFSFPAFINFTKYHILNDHSTRAGTFIGIDSTGTNRLLGSFNDDWTTDWVARTLSSNYYVNKWYLVMTRQRVIRTELHFNEVFFDGSYQVSDSTTTYNNTTIITSSDSSYNNINDASNNTNLYNIIDRNLTTYTQLEKGLGKYIDVSLNTPIDISSIQSFVAYSSIINNNPSISKIRYESVGDVSLNTVELQVWFDNSNILAQPYNSIATSGIYTNISNINDASFNSSYSTDKGIGKYIDIDLSNRSLNDLQAIVNYIDPTITDLSNQKQTKIVLYDDSNVPIIEVDNSKGSNISYNIFKYKGHAYNDSLQKLQNFRFVTENYSQVKIDELQLWVDNSNILLQPSNVVITQSSTNDADISSNIIDQSFNTYALTQKGLNEYIDVSLNYPVKFAEIQGIVAYSEPPNTNFNITKIRYITTDNIPLQLSELQVWVNNNNIVSTGSISTSGPVTQVTEDLVPFVPRAERIWNGSYETISTDYQFTYNGVTYLYWDKPLDSQTWMQNNGTNIPTSGIAINSRIFSPTKSTLYYGYNEYYRYMNLFDVRIKDYGHINNLTNYIDFSWSWAALTLPIYIVWRTDGLKTANKLQLTCNHGFPDGMPKQFDIVSYTGTIPNFEDTSIVTNLQAITWNTITSINETNPYTVTTFSNDGYDSVETKSYDFTSTSANYFAIKIYDNFHATEDTISITDINWQNVSNVYTDASNITDASLNTSYTSSQGIGEYVDTTFISPNNFNYNDLNAIMLHNISSIDQSKTKVILYDDSNIPVVEYNTSPINSTIYKYKGPSYENAINKIQRIKLETNDTVSLNINELQLWIDQSNVLIDSNNIITTSSTISTDISSNITDLDFNTSSKTIIGTGEYIDISLNTTYDLSKVEGIIIYSNIETNPIISKIRYETTSHVPLELSEFQIWVGNSNITANTYSVSSGNDISNIYNDNINYHFNTEQGIGEYIDISFNSFNYNDLQAIITYNVNPINSDLSNQNSTKITLYDDSGIQVVQYTNDDAIDTSYNYYKYKGPDYNSSFKKLKKIRIETTNKEVRIDELQVWVDNENKISSKIIAPTYSFILNGSNKSLTSLYSSDSLTLVNNPTFDTNGVFLNGINQYITIPQTVGSFDNDDFTISLWMKATDITTGIAGTSGSVYFSPGYNNTNSFWFGRQSTSNILSSNDLSTTQNHTSSTVISVDNIIHNYVISKQNNTIRFFADNIKIIEYNRSTALPTSDYHIGYSLPRGDGGGIFIGYIYRVDIWKNYGFSN